MKPSFIALLVFVSAAMLWILLPFYGTILWGFVIALLSMPIYRWLYLRFNHRSHLAAATTIILVFTIVVIPLALITASLANEVVQIVGDIQSGQINPAKYFQQVYDALPAWAVQLLERFGLFNFASLQKRLTDLLLQASQSMAKQAITFGQLTFEFVANGFLTLYLAFFLIRDGKQLGELFKGFLPLSKSNNEQLITKFTAVVRATVKGNILVAGIQGLLGGVAFWALGISASMLWGVLMAFLSLIPAVGAALIWVPTAIYLFATGLIWQGIALVAWGVLVIGLVDNLLRPLLVGRETRLPDYVVLLSTLGGLATFGINGFVLGPLSAAMFIAVWQIQSKNKTEL